MSYTGALRSALTEWAPEKMKSIPGPLFLILIDHGSPDTFFLTGEQPLTAQTLDGWLETLQNQMKEYGVDQKIVVILGACYSGSFIDDISAPGRIVVTASAANEPSYRGPGNPYSGVRDGEFFTSALFGGLGAGLNLRAAFENAVVQTETHTDSGTNTVSATYNDMARQHPLLDDNGDGKGADTASAADDGAVSENVVLGFGESAGTGNSTVAKAGTVPVTPPALAVSETSAALWAEVSESTPGKSEVWVEIRRPGMILEEGADTQQTVDLKNVKLVWNDSEKRYIGTYDSFTESGRYRLFFYARGGNGIISPFAEKFLYKAKAGMPGDVNDDGIPADLADAVLALKTVCAGDLQGANISTAADTDGDKKIGLHEVLYILRKLAGL
jgi:hypothetical protein